MGFTTVTFCAALLVLANAGPVYKLAATEESACSLTCSDTNKFDYQPGTVYEFSYDAKTTTKMNGASEDSAIINMNAKVEIEPITKCDLVMRIKDASLRDSEDQQNSQAFKEAMMKHALKFSFQDGRIDHICSTEGESIWTLNIKRGILSAFQNSMDSFDRDQNLTETDVVGTCRSEYKVVRSGRRNEIVEKTKNLLSCSDREAYRLAVQSIGYNVPSFVKSLPLMKSEYKCTQTLDLGSNILQSSTCSEDHVFRPFSYGKNGAMTSSEQTLTFTNKRRAGRPSRENFNQRSTLLFHHQDDIPSKQDKEDKIEAKLQELCQKAAEDIRPEVPEMVNQLIGHMRQVDRDVLSRVYKKINQRTICAANADRIKQYFHDAIPMVGTEASVGMIQDLISKKRVTGSEAEMWLLSLSFVHHPTKEMVAAATPLLDERDVSGNTLLAVSSLASSYCNARRDCGKDSEITTLLRKLIDHTHDCNTQNGDARRIIFALRAIGNIGYSHEIVSHLTRCFTRRDVREEIRIAAMDAFRRIPCDAMRSDLMGVFRDESEDSELRLNAYIALMKCPSRNVLSEVRQVLEKEKSNQVGSFVWSHLTNLMETSDPHMQDIRHIVQDEELKKEFNLDQRKFSRNYEGSFFLDSINMGAKVDSNVIFSQKSFIPRSANLNLTIDLFGHAINFLEFGGRVQGVENILVNFFGPSGTHTPALKSRVPINFDKNMDAFRASAYLRVFGNELRYWDDKSLNELQSSLKRLMQMQSLSFSKTMALLDSRMVIPTCVGLPLNLTISTTGSISLDAKASFQRPNYELNIDFRPSASIQVKGEMSVDAHVSRAGLKMVTVAHTSTGAKLDIRNNKFDLQIPQKKMEIFNLKTDFYIVRRNAEQRQRMIVDNVKKHEICTGKFMKQVTGLSFCQILKFPNASHHKEAPFFPFTGPVVYDLYMINEDAPNGYQIEGFTKQSPYSFYMDTPNSKVSRRIAIDTVMKNKNEAHITFKAPWKNIKIEGTVVNMLEMKKLTGTVSLNGHTEYALNAQLGVKNTKGLLSFTPKFDITIPQKRMEYEGIIEIKRNSLLIDMSAKGFIANDINLKVSGEMVPNEIGLTTQFRIGKKEYYIASRLGTLVSKSGIKYTPSLKITTPNRDLVEFTSEILYESKKKMSFDFKLNKVFPKKIAMNALVLLNAGQTRTKHIVRILFKSPRGNFKIFGELDNKKTGITSRVTGSYNFGKKYSDRLTLSSKIRDLSPPKSVRYMGNIALESKKREYLNFNLKGQLAKANNHLETKFDLHYGNSKIKTNNLKFACVLNRALKTFSHAYDYAMSIQHPGKKINYKVEANHVQSSKWPFKKFENKVMIQMAPGKVVQTRLSYINAKVKGLPTYESEMSLSYPGRDMKIADKLMQVNRNTYENNFSVQWQKGREAMVKSTYTRTGKDINNIENTLILPNKKEVKVTAMLQATSGAYKVKTQFAADEEVILRQPINYKAEGGVRYTFNARQMSSDVNAEIMWSPNKKISTNINFDYIKKGSFNSKFAFTTPFNIITNVDTQFKYTWANRKYTSIMSVSWNNENELKHDFSFVYPDFQLSYDASALLNGKKSEVGVAMKYSDMSLNGNIKVHHDKTTVIDAILKHSTQRMNSESEIVLEFDILRSNGKMKITSKYDKQKGELMSNGEGKLNLPLQYLRQVGASYNFKHKDDLCSIDMSYSSSLRNYRNGKMSIEMKRNLPKMLMAKMDMTLNGNLMFNMGATYERQRDNIDMKVDITDANGKMATVSGNINFSGDRKTANVKIDSRYTKFSADGAFEYKGIRSAAGELKVTADGKSVMMRANYKKEATTYKMSGTLGLPDGRSLKMEGSLDLQNIAASFKTMSPDFPELTQIDMSFFFNGNKRLFSSTASLKVMPYFDRTQVEMKLTKKLFSIEMKTQFETMKQAKATVMFDGDWIRSHKTKVVFQLNNEEMVDLDINYNFNSMRDFGISIAALTSHRRYKDFQFELKNKGPLSSMQSSLILKLANVLTLDAMFQNSRKASKASLDAQILDFDEWKSTFELKGNLDYMTANIITSIAKKEVNRIDAILKEYGRSINLKVSGPNPVNFDFNMKIDPAKDTFDMSSTLTLNSRQIYDMSVFYKHVSKLQIKTSIPSYQDELIVTFSGNLKAFKAQTKFSHNNQIYELMLSNKEYYRQVKAILNTPYFQDTANFNFDGELSAMNIFAQVMHNKHKFEVTFSNSGYYQQIDAKVDTPVFQAALKGNPTKFNFESMIHFQKQIYEMKASNEDYFRQMNFLLNTPDLNSIFQFNKTGGSFQLSYGVTKYELKINMKNKFKFFIQCINPGFNLRPNLELQQEEIYKIVVTYEHLAKLYINISFPSYNDELTMTLNGDLKMFNALAKLKHNTSKYELTISNQGYYRKIDAQLVTPFFTEMASFIFNGDEETFNARAKFMHDNDSYRNINLKLTKPSFKIDLLFKADAKLKRFYSTSEFTFYNKLYKLYIGSTNYYESMAAKLTLPTFKMNTLLKYDGNLRLFNSTAYVNDDKLFDVIMTSKDYFHQMSVVLTTPSYPKLVVFHFKTTGKNLVTLDASVTVKQKTYLLTFVSRGLYQNIKVDLNTAFFHKTFALDIRGSPDNFNITAEVEHNENLYALVVIKEKSFFKINANITGPFLRESIHLTLNGSLQSFNVFAQIIHNKDQFQLAISTVNYYRQMKAELTTPYFKESLVFLFNGTRRKFNTQLTLTHNNIVYEVKASNREFHRQMNLQLSSPFIRCGFQYSIEMAKKFFLLTIEEEKYELNIYNKKSFQFNEIRLSTPQHKLKISNKIYYKKKGISAVVNVQFDNRIFIVTGQYKNAAPKYMFNVNFKTPYFTASLQSSCIDKTRKFSTNLKPWYKTFISEALTQNFYNDLDFNFRKPGMKVKFSIKGNLQKCKVAYSLKRATNLYEINLSNQKYFQNIIMEVSTPLSGIFKFTFNIQNNGNRFDLNIESTFYEESNKYVLNISSKAQGKEGVVKLVGPQINVYGHFNGDLKSFSFNANVVSMKEKYEVKASAKNYFRDIYGKLITPQFGEQSFSMKINGQLRDFNGFIEVKHNKELYRSEVSMANQEFRLSLPKLLEKLQVKLNGNWKNFEFIMQMMDYDGERIEIKASNKNFKEMKAHLAIPRIDNIDVLIKTNGDIRNGEATMKMAFGENVFENKVEMNFDGSQANFEIEPHYKILGRSGKAKLQIDLMFEDQSYKYELEADVEDVQFKSMASVKISSEISVLMTVNIPTFYASEMKLRLVSEGFRKTDMMLNLKSSRTGMTKIFYEHNGQMGNSFVTKGYIEHDGSRLTGYSLDSYFADDYSFDFKCDYDNFISKIETQGDLKFQGRKTIASLSVRTPFQVLKEFLISAETKMLRDSVNADVNVKLPNQEHSINIDVNSSNLNALLNVNMDKKSKNKQYQFQTSYKNTDRRDDVSRSFNFRMVLPERTVSFDSRFESTRRSLLLSSHLIWDEIRDQKAGFELMVQKGENKEGKLRIITPRRTMELYSRVEVNGNHYSTTGHIMMDVDNKDQKVDLKVDMMTSSDRADIDVTIKFPNQREGMNLKTTANLPKGDIIFSSTSEFSIDQDPQKTFKMSTKLMSERRGQHEMYTMQMDAGHAHTGFATEVIGRVSSSPEKYNADVEMGYLTLKRQQQKFAIRGEIHTLNREANLKLEAPSKTIELDGSIRTGNRFMMSALKKESGKENMEALFKLNPNSKRMNIIFNYDEADPNKIYRIDADLMKTKANLKAYRTNKQRKQFTDGRVTVELKTNNLLQSYIKWNPDFLEELNMFGYQKLTMYGKEMKSFGDSVIHVLNDEVSMKFALAKRSFSEEMAPIRDYFATEYNSMAEDITRVMRHMNRMFEQDFLYVQTAITAINNEWHEMWLSFNRFLKGMKHMIEDFNWDLKHRMEEAKKQFDYYYGQYSMQLKNKVNEFHAYCKQKCEMLYERAMEMKTEIVSFLKDYPSTIKDLMDRMRRNPYGEKLIDFLMTMYEEANKKTVEAKEHVQTLTSAIYSAHATLNRHIAKVRRYPIVDAIMDAINEMYQQALWAYNYWDVTDNVLGLKKTLYKFGAEKIKQVKDIVTDVGMNTLIFDPKRGEIILEIRLGAAKYAYNHFMSSVEDLERAVMKLSNLMPNIDLNVWDIYYMMKPSSDLYDYIPPFKAEATLFAGQYITTFDGRHLNYKATCSYLLARDFVDGNFSVVANFDADRRAKTLKSLSLTTAHNEQVQIFPSNKVFYNGQMVKLPLKLTDATVTRQDNLIVVESKRGYKVMCDHDIQLYTVQISGWYFNKIAGLFGNYNNEPEDDMLMSNNRYTNDLEKFAQSWSVSRQCRSHRNFAPSHMVPENRDCAHFFLQSDSPFRYCFKQVNPDQFYKTCAMQLSYSKATPIDLCYVTSFYMRKCENKGVYLSMPVMCPRNI